jgi:hypothetical protein
MKVRQMTPDRKKPGVAFWATAAVTVALLYVASFGPACWISSRAGIGQKIVAIVYRPILWNLSLSEESTPIDRSIKWYSTIGAAYGYAWYCSFDPDSSTGYSDWEWGPAPTFF